MLFNCKIPNPIFVFVFQDLLCPAPHPPTYPFPFPLPHTCTHSSGGLDSKSQEAALRKNPDIVIATPGRLIDHLHNAPSFNLQSIEILVLDEADRWVT